MDCHYFYAVAALVPGALVFKAYLLIRHILHCSNKVEKASASVFRKGGSMADKKLYVSVTPPSVGACVYCGYKGAFVVDFPHKLLHRIVRRKFTVAFKLAEKGGAGECAAPAAKEAVAEAPAAEEAVAEAPAEA